MATENRDIKYINKDFSDFRSALINYTKTYFPNTYNDFSPSSPGMLFMEMSAYVGDVLSFYLDNQIQENFIQFARQQNNIYTLAYMLGYRPKVTTAATVDIDIYQQVPSKLEGTTYVPDYNYALYINENLSLASTLVGGSSFLIQDPIDFSYSSSLDPTIVSTYSVNTTTNIPDYFLLKKTRKAISANIQTKTFDFGSPERFQTININNTNIIQVLDIVDSDGNEWYEVPYLAQETIYDTIKNTNPNDPNNYQDQGEVPYLLQLKKVPRRFVTRFTSPTNLQIQFGVGTNTQNNEEEIIPNPDNVGLGLPSKRSLLTTAFSPANFLYTNTYGISPSNTTLTVRYLTGGGITSNAPASTLTVVNNKSSNVKFQNNNLDPVLSQNIFESLAVTNPSAASGGQGADTSDDIRFNSLSTFATQLRTVTQDDYLVRALSLPPQYGSVAKAYIETQKLENLLPGETPSILNLYVLAFDNNKKLIQSSQALKQNLSTYLSQYRVINDSIKIKDAFIINIGIEFDIITFPEYNNNEVIFNCIQQLKDYFIIDKWLINEPIMLKDLYIMLDKVAGVQTVKNISITNKVGTIFGSSTGYSDYAYDIRGATQNNVIYPSLDPMIFEVKYPDIDIKGRVVPL
jgi:hypothetical protein